MNESFNSYFGKTKDDIEDEQKQRDNFCALTLNRFFSKSTKVL
jgi:hypothetical protein